MTGPIERLLADLMECSLGRLSAKEATTLTALIEDFLGQFGDHPAFGASTDVKDNDDEAEAAYWRKYLEVRTALPKGSISCTISVTVDVDALALGLPNGKWSAAEVAASIVTAMMRLLRRARVAASSNQATSDDRIILAATTCRLPGTDKDRLEEQRQSNHWCFFVHGDIYRLEVPETSSKSTYASLVSAIERMIGDERERPPNPLPAITTVERPEAARLRKLLMQNKSLARSITDIESAVGIIVIDRPRHEPTGVVFQRQLMTGNGLNRWFGKTTFAVCDQQWGGIQLDHAVFNGASGQRLVELLQASARAFAQAAARSHRPGRAESLPLRRLAPPPMERAILDEFLIAFRSSGQIEASFTLHGCLLSMPGATQSQLTQYLTIASQLVMAQHRGTLTEVMIPVRRVGSPVYSSDYIRSAFASVALLSTLWQESGKLDPQLLAKAISDWRKWFRRALAGDGIERKLKDLARCASSAGIDHPLFRHKVFGQRAAEPPLFLTIMPAPERVGARIYAFPPCIPTGWSICAFVGPGALRFDVTSRIEEAAEITANLVSLITQMYRIQDLASPAPVTS